MAAEALYQNEERIWQLLDAGIEGKDIPKVLVALGVLLDVEIATDLLRSPDIFMDIHAAIEVVVLPLPLTSSACYTSLVTAEVLSPTTSLHSLIAMRRYFGA